MLKSIAIMSALFLAPVVMAQDAPPPPPPPPAGGMPQPEQIFAFLDADKDGFIAKDEAQGPMVQYFANIDADKDEPDITRQVMTVVRFRHAFEHPQVSRRFELTYDLIDEVVHAVIDIDAEGEGALAQLFDLVLQGDFVSLHMAAEAGVDPGPIPALVDLKAALAR